MKSVLYKIFAYFNFRVLGPFSRDWKSITPRFHGSWSLMLLINFLPVFCFLVGVHRNIYTGSVLAFRSKWNIFFSSCFQIRLALSREALSNAWVHFSWLFEVFFAKRCQLLPCMFVWRPLQPLRHFRIQIIFPHSNLRPLITTLRALRRPPMSRICKYFKLSRGRIWARIVEQSLFIVTSENRVNQITKQQLLTRYQIRTVRVSVDFFFFMK